MRRPVRPAGPGVLARSSRRSRRARSGLSHGVIAKSDPDASSACVVAPADLSNLRHGPAVTPRRGARHRVTTGRMPGGTQVEKQLGTDDAQVGNHPDGGPPDPGDRGAGRGRRERQQPERLGQGHQRRVVLRRARYGYAYFATDSRIRLLRRVLRGVGRVGRVRTTSTRSTASSATEDVRLGRRSRRRGRHAPRPRVRQRQLELYTETVDECLGIYGEHRRADHRRVQRRRGRRRQRREVPQRRAATSSRASSTATRSSPARSARRRARSISATPGRASSARPCWPRSAGPTTRTTDASAPAATTPGPRPGVVSCPARSSGRRS